MNIRSTAKLVSIGMFKGENKCTKCTYPMQLMNVKTALKTHLMSETPKR